jgi:hypothetical protein
MRVISRSELLRAKKFELQVLLAKSRQACHISRKARMTCGSPITICTISASPSQGLSSGRAERLAGIHCRPAYAAIFLRCIRVLALGSWPSKALSCSASAGAALFWSLSK